MAKLILMRHGASLWNEKNLFTGWVDIPLSKKGVEEAVQAGKEIKDLPIDIIFCSKLVRSTMTALIAMNEHASGKVPRILHPNEGNLEAWGEIHNEETLATTIPTHQAWELNERMYGELQGLNKEEMRKKYGPEQVHIWRRSFDTPPPNGESLKMTAERTLPYFDNTIVPELEKGKNVLVSAHGNSLRSIIMVLRGLSGEEVVKLELATGKPMIWEYRDGKFYEE
ncbi:MAG: 2,3-bisphosphoglycerate-dependent phosphoglycerate mutase [Chlamydiia bacterium]|nr:2,3-bisphosphoglycerate-dependent phosphoglycerate mutase [Chlamydiia bacterium]